MTDKNNLAADFVRSLPYFVWFCGIFAYLFVLIQVSTSIEGRAGTFVMLLMAVPYVWFIWVRFQDD